MQREPNGIWGSCVCGRCGSTGERSGRELQPEGFQTTALGLGPTFEPDEVEPDETPIRAREGPEDLPEHPLALDAQAQYLELLEPSRLARSRPEHRQRHPQAAESLHPDGARSLDRVGPTAQGLDHPLEDVAILLDLDEQSLEHTPELALALPRAASLGEADRSCSAGEGVVQVASEPARRAVLRFGSLVDSTYPGSGSATREPAEDSAPIGSAGSTNQSPVGPPPSDAT